MNNNNSSLSVTNEKDRANKYISSILYSRATLFHPSGRLTPKMKLKLVEVAEAGGTSLGHPLDTIHFQSYGKSLRADLHVNYLLQSHRDILETMLAYGRTIELDDESYEAGGSLSWAKVLGTLSNCVPSATHIDGFDSFLDRDSVVLSMSMYDLTKWMRMAPARKSYDLIEERLLQLSTAKLIINELDDEGFVIDKRPLSFIQDFRFVCDKSKFKGDVGSNLTNHVFIVPDRRLLDAIRDQGYWQRLEQGKIFNYKSVAVRSFLKYIATHDRDYVDTKTLEWTLDYYIKSIASEVGISFKRDLRNQLIQSALQVEVDFSWQIRDTGIGYQLFDVRSEGVKSQ